MQNFRRFPATIFELLTTNTHNTQGAFQIFSFFTVFHYITLSKSHWEQINGKPDIFFCYHCTILTVRSKFTILVKDFLNFFFVFVFVKCFQNRRCQSYQVFLVAYGHRFETKKCQIVPKNATITINENPTFGDQISSLVILTIESQLKWQ